MQCAVRPRNHFLAVGQYLSALDEGVSADQLFLQILRERDVRQRERQQYAGKFQSHVAFAVLPKFLKCNFDSLP